MDKTGRLNFIELGIDDMTNLVELSDESLLYNLQTRYNQKIIYTYIGSILISINPYKELGIYDNKHILRYQNRSMQEVPPHLFGIAEINYSKMMMENENQVIVISGESGAGKTESFKRILRYLAYTSGGTKDQSSTHQSNEVANKILDSTPLLESFGNAKTIRNDNSSRFGKYVEILFENGVICGSRTTNYLLEKSRIVNINPDERGYHIFYELLQGLDSFAKSQYYLKNVVDYDYLNNSRNFSIKDRDDATNLKEFMSQWSTLGLTNHDLDVTMRIISAVLHLGNIKFGEEEDISYMLETENVNIVAKMLKVDSASLISCLTMKTTDTVKDIASSPVNAEQAANLRDTLAKHLYSELFDWIVVKVNESLNEKTVTLKRSTSNLDRSMNSSSSKLRCIAMLDIYGFENFPENSLEQLCINYANETLQQFFNRYVFELEQAEYKQEGISWHYVTYPDNQPIIDLLAAKPSGIIQILNDECSIPQGSDTAFLTKCYNVHQKNANFEKPKKVHPPEFVIRHFAGNIFYNVTGFLEKNRDIIRKDAILLIEHCGVEEIANMFKKKKEKTLKNPNIKARTPAVMADFQNSLSTLLNKMKTCQPWFIRCLKPNKNKEALTFDKVIVMDQMKYTGILETVKIRKSGFPIRIAFGLFLSRFYLLQTKDLRRQAKKDPQETCLKMMPKYGGQKGKDFEVGKTKLFLKEHFARHLESQVRVIRERSAIKIQRRWRAYWKIRVIIIKNNAATTLQSIVRGFLIRRRIKKFHIAIVKLQAFVRMQLVRRRFIEDHPEFLKYTFNQPETVNAVKSTATAYKFPEVEVSKKPKNAKDKKAPTKFNYNFLKIPMKLAFLLESATENYGEGHMIPNPDNVIQTGRAQHLYNRDECRLPVDINDYQIEYFIEEFGNNVSLESKIRPITTTFLKDSMSQDFRDDSLNAHKLILRLIYVDSMPWFHRFLAGSYLSYMASTSPQLQMEILIQIIAETIHIKNQGNNLRRKNLFKDPDLKGMTRGWTILGNILSHIIPVPEIFKHVLQFISVSFGIDQACTCQEKLLEFVNDNRPKVPRLFPASNLEWRANGRGAKTSLKAFHPDDVQNSVHVNSFTTAESFANHSLCFRLKKFRVNKGWSVSIVSQDTVIDCSGHNYIFDVITGQELTSHWREIVGYGTRHKFLTSKKAYNHETLNSDDFKAQLFNKPKKYAPSSVTKSKGTVSSRKSMDSWVDKYFDKSFKNEEGSARVEDFIHGLEDELLAQRNNNQNPTIIPYITSPTLGINQMVMPGAMTPHSAYGLSPQPYGPIPQGYYYQPQSDRRYLEEQLNAVELQNRVITSSIENELLQKRLKELRQQESGQAPLQPSHPGFSFQPQQSYNPILYPMQGGQYMIHEPYLSTSHHTNQQNSGAQSSISQLNHTSDSSYVSTPEVTKHTPLHKETMIPRSSAPLPPSPPHPPPPPSHHHQKINGDRDLPTHITDRTSDQDQIKAQNLKKKRSIVKYSDISPASNVVVDDSTVLPQFPKNENVPKSQLRAAEIPKVNVANRAAFLDKFFLEKNNQSSDPAKSTKRRAPMSPMTDIASQLNNHTDHVPAPPLLIPQPRLIPRPSIHAQSSLLHLTDDEVDKEDMSNDNDLQDTLSRLDDLLVSAEKPSSTIPPEIKKRRKRMSSSYKTAVILSGLPDIRYYTYANLPWFVLVKIELFLPNDIQDSTILTPVIFCQIVKDLTEYPCIRWVGNEKKELLSMIGSTKDFTDVRSLLLTPTNLMLNVIDRAQNCELYFSRFYSIQWLSTNASGQVCHWLSISHSGIRFVEQNIKDPEPSLKIVHRIPYSNLNTIECDCPDFYNNPQKLIIKTKSNKVYEMESTHALSAINLVQEFVGNRVESLRQSAGGSNGISSNLFQHKKNKRKTLKDNSFYPEPSSDLMTLGVNNQRIPVKNFLDDTMNMLGNKDPTLNKTGNLFDFMLYSSKYKNKDEVENKVLKWQVENIKEPFLPTLNNNLLKVALELFQFVRTLSGDINVDGRLSILDIGISIFKTLNRNRELIEEVIVQIMKQINGNPRDNCRQTLWHTLTTLIMFYGVTKRMEPFLLTHLKMIVKMKENPDQDLTNVALTCLKRIISFGPRKELPLDSELIHLLSGEWATYFNIYIPKDCIECRVNFSDTVGEVIKNVCQTFTIVEEYEISEYSLGMVEVNDQNVPIKNAECLQRESYIFDIINLLSRKKKTHFIFYFSRSSWIFPIKPSQRSQNMINFIFNQLSKDVLTENWMLFESNDMKYLKALLTIAYFNIRGQEYIKPLDEAILNLILPSYMLAPNKFDISKAEMIDIMNSTPQTVDMSLIKDKVDYQRKFIELVTQLPLFGWIRFPILHLHYIPESQIITINFTPEHICIINDTKKESIIKIPLASLNTYQVTKNGSNPAQFHLRFNGTQQIQFASTYVSEVATLLDQYQNIGAFFRNRRSK